MLLSLRMPGADLRIILSSIYLLLQSVCVYEHSSRNKVVCAQNQYLEKVRYQHHGTYTSITGPCHNPVLCFQCILKPFPAFIFFQTIFRPEALILILILVIPWSNRLENLLRRQS